MTKIDLSLIQQLREMTAAGMMDCKKALIEADGNMEKAKEILRKKGAAISEKRADNATCEGLVHAYIHPGANLGVLIEINCETDFVARTDDMKKFAHDICMHIAAINPRFVSAEKVDKAIIEKEMIEYREQLVAQKKPAQIIDKIIEGKLEKYYEENCLLSQKFVKDDSLTVGDLLQSLVGKLGEKIIIYRFTRFEIGV